MELVVLAKGWKVFSLKEFSRWATGFFSINTIIITVFLIGMLFIMVFGGYLLSRKLGAATQVSLGIRHQINNVVWFVLLSVSMLFLQTAYSIMSYYNSQWEFSNVQFIILFFCLYNIRNGGIIAFNYILPLVKSYQYLVVGRIDNVWIYLLLLIILFLDITYISNGGLTFNDSKKHYKLYLVTLFFFVIGWWGMLCVAFDFSPEEMGLKIIGFAVLASIIHFLYRFVRNIEKERASLERDVKIDELTGANNRAEFDKVKDQIFRSYDNKDQPLGIAMFDIDHFKQFNDQYGHTVGDGVLKETVRRVQKGLLDNQTGGELFRVGGEEFLIIFRDHSAKDVRKIMKIIRDAVAGELSDIEGRQLRINISCGITELKATDTNFSDLYNRVDSYLYQSKRQGRNRITVEGQTQQFT